MSLSTQPYKGTRDFYPEDKRRQDYMFSIIRKCVKSYGYEEYDAPLLEPLELYLAKTGEEIINEQTYSFKDRGGRDVVIRPEMTPTVSRMVAAKRQELAYPLRWFSIPNLWRYERPQKGRLREHWQLNVDLFGVSGTHAELEIIMVADSMYKAFNATSSMFTFKLNHRGLMDMIFKDYLGLSEAQAYSMAKVIDRKNKLEHTLFIEAIDMVFTPTQREVGLTEKLINILNSKKINSLPEEIRTSKEAEQLTEMLDLLNQHSINNVEFDITLMRGFDYYSGIVFEVFDNHPDNNRSMMGGGRYDGLVGLFGVDPVPTVGFGLGDATLANFLDLHKLMPELNQDTDIYIVTVGEVYEGATKIASELRKMGANVAVDYSGRKLGDQIKAASKMGIDYIVVVGSQELESANYTLRNLKTATEEKHSLERIISIVFDHRQKKK